MSSRYPHTCTLTRPGPDTRPVDPESGQPTGPLPAPVALYDGRCRFTSEGSAVRREKGGDVDVSGQALLELPRGAVPVLDAEIDLVTVRANGVVSRHRIIRASNRRFDVRLLLTPAEAVADGMLMGHQHSAESMP